jgi:hypothetical protein
MIANAPWADAGGEVIFHTIIGGRTMRTSVKYLGGLLILLTVAYMALLGAYGSTSFMLITGIFC